MIVGKESFGMEMTGECEVCLGRSEHKEDCPYHSGLVGVPITMKKPRSKKTAKRRSGKPSYERGLVIGFLAAYAGLMIFDLLIKPFISK